MFVLAHFSDPHLAPLPFPPPWALANKRFFGCLSWYARKRTVHQTPVLAALIADLKKAAPDHIAITGDLTNISLPAEFARVRRWLEELGSPRDVSVVPGNHDAYVAMEFGRSMGQWAPFMSGGAAGDREMLPASEEDFPFVRRRGPIALIGLTSAVPMPLFGTPAAGRLGARQIEKLKVRLSELVEEGLFRVVLIHHPPYRGVSPRKGLADAGALCDALGEAGAELVLYGHLHEPGLVEIATPSGRIPAVGLPSASARSHKGKPASRYHLYRLSGMPGDWQLDVEVREVEASLDRFRTAQRLRLNIGRGGLQKSSEFPPAARDLDDPAEERDATAGVPKEVCL